VKFPKISSLWLGVGLLFGLMFAAWAVLLHLAAKNPTASVPLETAPAAAAVVPAKEAR
jgi:hypothetical protein